MKILSFLYILLLINPIVTLCQDLQTRRDSTIVFPDTPLVVDTIMIVGNIHTKDFVIVREMSLQTGTRITKELLQYDQERIYSLGLFNRVQLHVALTSHGQANIIVEVSERWYIFPFPVVGIKDRNWDKLYYGVGLLHSNFRGRNEKLFATFIFGYDPSISLSYRNPFLKIDGSYILDTRVAYNKIRNKSVLASRGQNNFDEQHLSFSANLGKRIGIKHTIWLITGYEHVNVSDPKPGRTNSPDGKDNYPIVGVSYAYDTRDLYEYPAYGTLAKAAILKYGIPSHAIDLVRYTADFRRYIPLGSNFVFTTRFFTDLVAAGPTPSYNHVFFGYTERIRGHFKEVMEGDNLFGVSTELHYPLLKPVYFKFDFLPAEFSILKFGVVAAAFADAGTVWFRHQPFAVNNFAKGYGVGIHFILPYSWILRTEYALNETHHGEFILDLGSSF